MTATSVEIANTPEDYRAFARVTRRRVGAAPYIALAVGGVVAMAAIFLLPPYLESMFAPGSNLPLIASTVLALGLWFAAARLTQRASTERSFDRDGMYREKKRITLSDDGIHVETAHSRSLMYWSGVKDVVATKDHVFVMYDRAVGMIVPRRSFAFPSDADGFADAVRAHIKGK